MKHTEAERLLGGYATDTLSAAERTTLFAAALDHQDLFDALMDEEALRELLADPEAKAQLLAALSRTAPPKAVPFWRRTGVLGAAASLIVAATAGLAYLRSPGAGPPPMKQEEVKAPAVKAVPVPAEAPARSVPVRKVAPVAPLKGAATPVQVVEAPAPAPPPQMMAAPAAAMEDSARMRTQGELRRAEAQDNLAKKAEAPRPVAAAAEVVPARRSDSPERRAAAQSHSVGGLPGGVPGDGIGGVMGGVAGPPPSRPAPKAKAIGGVGMNAATPTWRLDAQPDGSTRVTVNAPRGSQVELLRRGASGVEVLKLQTLEDRGSTLVQRRCQIRLAEREALDLYLLNRPVADPGKLPESGPVDGFRARIYPASKN